MVGALAEVQGKYGEEAASNMKDTAAFISGIDENIGKGLQDALSGNLGTPAAQQFKITAGELGSQAVDMLRKGQISTAEASAMIQDGLKKTADNFGGPAGLGKLAGLDTPIENSILGLQKFAQRADITAADFQKTIDKNKELATTTDAATNNLVDSSVKMQKFATELDKISLKLMGSAGLVGAVGSVTDAMLASATEMNKMIAMGPEAYAKSKLGEVEDKVPDAKTTALSGVAGGAVGAVVGSLIGPVGTILGAKLGAMAGLALGAWFSGPGKDDVADKVAKKEGSTGNSGTTPKIKGLAVGGPADAGETYLVGESGPELLTMGSMGGTVTPNAGPAGGSVAALGGIGNPIDQTISELSKLQSQGDSAGSGGSGNALAEAQINRLDQLITQMARSNSTNEEILHATRQ